jgi:hypothetical protein
MLKYVDAIQAIWYSFFEVKFCYRPSRKSPILHFQILCLGLYELCKLAWNWCFKIDVLHYYHIILLVLDGLLHQHFSICCFLFSRALYVNTPWLWISCIGTRGLTERAFFFIAKSFYLRMTMYHRKKRSESGNTATHVSFKIRVENLVYGYFLSSPV